MVLQGCGGDDGVDQGLHDQVVSENETLKSDNETLKSDNETLQSDNETLQSDNETLQEMVDALPDPLPGPDTDAFAEAVALEKALDAASPDADNTFATTNFPSPTITATRTNPTEIKVEQGTDAGDFEMTEPDPASIMGWSGARFVRDTSTADTPDTAIEHVVVYTDIEAPEMLAVNGDNVEKLTGTPTGNAALEVEDGAISDVNMNSDGLYMTHIMLNDAANAGSTATYTGQEDDDETDLAMAYKLTLAGTFAGAMGEYSCSGDKMAACSVVVDSDGKPAGTAAGDWKFTAAEGAMIALADAEYLYFGWWVESPAEGETGDHKFQTFVGAAMMAEFTGGDIQALEGEVTYEGAAAGVYTMKDTIGGQVVGADSGEFTASAKLTAEFLNDAQAGSINGRIDTFMDADGEAMDGWEVTLKSAYLSNSNTFSSTTSAMVGAGTEGSGSWEATFRGVADDGDDTTTNDPPMAVVGKFDADFDGANLAGAFGATKK